MADRRHLRSATERRELFDGIPGDEESLYDVELPTRNPFEELSEWTGNMSGHSAFPRWDGPTEEAFEWVSWQFHGSLEDALVDLDTR